MLTASYAHSMEGDAGENKIVSSDTLVNRIELARRLPKIDIHCHTTNRPLPGASEPDASISVICKRMEEWNIEQCCLLATYFPERGTGISNFRLLHWIKEYDRARMDGELLDIGFRLFGSLDMNTYFTQGYNELEELANAGWLRGIKLYTGYQQFDLRGDKMSKVAQLAGKHRLILMFHGGYVHGNDSSPPSHLDDIDWLSRKHPETPMVVSHLCAPYVAELAELAKSQKNVFADLSGIDGDHATTAEEQATESVIADTSGVQSSPAGQLRLFLSIAGPKKVLFGTDFPVQTHQTTVRLVEDAMWNYSQEDRAAVYYGNADSLLMHVTGRWSYSGKWSKAGWQNE